MKREITYAQAVLEATDQCMSTNKSVYIMGLGVPDPKGIFGTTLGLRDKYGSQRVIDMPISENAMTGDASLGDVTVNSLSVIDGEDALKLYLGLDDENNGYLRVTHEIED